MQAEFKNGVLSVHLPRSAIAKPKADYQNGMLNIAVPIPANARAKQADIKAT